MPRAATSVATQTRARPSRSDCSARERSAWESSPESATAEKPRSVRLACSRFTLARVAQNTMAMRGSSRRRMFTTARSISWGATRLARYSMSLCWLVVAPAATRSASRW